MVSGLALFTDFSFIFFRICGFRKVTQIVLITIHQSVNFYFIPHSFLLSTYQFNRLFVVKIYGQFIYVCKYTLSDRFEYENHNFFYGIRFERHNKNPFGISYIALLIFESLVCSTSIFSSDKTFIRFFPIVGIISVQRTRLSYMNGNNKSVIYATNKSK